MANYYCDHGVYGLTTNRIGLDAPSWGVPQEGDGSSKDAATASSIGSVVFTVVPTTGVISICGASVSTTNVLNAADVDTAANALATNINSTSATVSTAAAYGTPQLRNLVYARGPSAGAAAGTCEIMMRVGSTKLNYSVNSNSAIASTLDGTPTINQFAGGSGGCWGWILNPIAFGASNSIAAYTYGSWLYSPYVVASAPTKEDFIWLRTGGASKTINISSNTSISLTASVTTNVIADTNTVWTGDGVDNSISISFVFTSSYQQFTLRVAPYANAEYSLEAIKYGGFKIKVTGIGGSSGGGIINNTSGQSGRKIRFHNIHFIDESAQSLYYLSPIADIFDTKSNFCILYSSCLFQRTALLSTIPFITYMHPANYGGGNIDFIGCHFDYNLTGTNDPGPLINSGVRGNPTYTVKMRFINTKFTGYAQGFNIYSSAASMTGIGVPLEIVFDNCSGVKLPDAYWGFIDTISANNQKVFTYIDSSGNFRYESDRGVSEFVTGSNIPTLTATLFDQSTLWAIRVIWIASGVHSRSNPYYLPKFTTYSREATATKTVTIELLVPTALNFAFGDVMASVSYTDNNGVSRVETASVVESSTAAWSNAPVGYSAKKLSLTTANQILGNSEINCQVSLAAKPSSGITEYIYVNPEIDLV